ncbi:MAG TPA: hypothetical protein VMT34_11505, partial [Aggregatilineales bacterium]|nr:hypothetical protein [Aggregatilineales bacterium]
IREEYGITIAVTDLLTVMDHILPEEKQHWVSSSYICRIAEGSPIMLELQKCSEIGWFAVDDIPDAMTQVTQHDLTLYRDYVRQHPANTGIAKGDME